MISTSMVDDGGGRAGSHNANELQQALEELKNKNVELKRVVNYIKTENSSYKQKYNVLRKKLFNLTELLEKNANIFNQLFDDAKCALQLGRVPMINSPISTRKSIRPRSSSPKEGPTTALVKCSASRRLNIEHGNIEDSRNDSPKAGPSGMVASSSSSIGHVRTISVRKVHIEPMNMQEFEQIGTENEAEFNMEVSEEEIVSSDKLSTIQEESSRASELCVKLERLPVELVQSYIQNQKTAPLNNFSLNSDDSVLLGGDPNFSSTPLKIDTLNRLGLMPSPKMLNDSNSIHQFVSRRKRTRSQTSTSKADSRTGLISPKKEKLSLTKNINLSLVNAASPERKISTSRKENLVSPKTEKFPGTPPRGNSSEKSKKRQLNIPATKVKSKRKKFSPEVSPAKIASRPARRARPTNLKEETLKGKKRRN